MGSSVVEVGPSLAVVLVVLAAVVGRASGLGQGRPLVVAALRAAVQLAVVSAVVVVVRSLWASVGFAVLMLAVAAVTSAGRVTGAGLRRSGAVWRVLTVGTPIAAGVLPVLTLVLASGSVPLRGEAVVPVAGILIGGAMSATSLAGRRLLDELDLRHGEVEAALASGSPRGTPRCWWPDRSPHRCWSRRWTRRAQPAW